jgi:hypothetical protein
MDKHIQEGIISSVAFFDAIDISLTDAELYELGFDAPIKPAWNEFQTQIDELVHAQILRRSGASIFFPGRDHLIEERVTRGLLSEKKFTLASRAAQLIRFIPFIRMVAVCNTLSFEMSRLDGDVDLFIIAEKGRVHIVHMLTTFVFHLFRMRRHGFYIANRMCLSFYVAKDGMDVSRFSLEGRDPYLAQWIRHVIPIFSIQKTAETYWQANEQWLKKYFAEAEPYIPGIRRRVQDSFFSKSVRRTFEFVLSPFVSWLERDSLRSQKQKLAHSAKHRMRSQPHDVAVDERTLKFHEEDRRAFYRDKMEARLAAWRKGGYI